jgi:putative heme-binding domain-containing protein
VLTDDGRSFAGIIREETAAEVMLQTSATATERIRRAAIESLQAGTVSLMPKGYDTLLTPQEVADLVAFLARAK